MMTLSLSAALLTTSPTIPATLGRPAIAGKAGSNFSCLRASGSDFPDVEAMAGEVTCMETLMRSDVVRVESSALNQAILAGGCELVGRDLKKGRLVADHDLEPPI